MVAICRTNVKATAPKRGMFENNPWLKRDSRSERIASTCASCDRQRTVNTIVCQCDDALARDQAWVPSTRAAIKGPTHSARTPSPRAKTLSCGGRGGGGGG